MVNLKLLVVEIAGMALVFAAALFLAAEYDAYTARVRYRLVPYVW